MSSQPITSNVPPLHAGTLEVHLLGLVDFPAFLGLQEYVTYEMSGRKDLSGKLFLCEHPPMITVGREGKTSEILIDEEQRERMELPVYWISRGGGAYAHAQGQLAIYLMLPLDRLGIGLVEYRRLIETAACESCHELKIPAKRHPEFPGVWGRGGQLAFFGSSVRSWVSNHGLFLNVTISPDFLEMTVPNSDHQRAISIQAQRIPPVQMSKLRESLIRTISKQFGYETTDVSTGHPLLKKTTRQVAKHV
ncbi:lipoyl(octanoyl) transferase LipB [Thalassoglobus polymorphus]|uniref:Octanoyltransferase n=1 Tax=Thalassoglobus polymorphus TaxID=2527994 RepID=A0A517QKY0_9PLAN|nr:hypothetical protein [Thalassoglobus polymorphus]QDT32288.1 Octanoyltransferase [Thalassoglobus polymorphus]